MKPLNESVRAVEATVAAARTADVEFVLNARTDAFLHAADRDPEEVLSEAIRRGRAGARNTNTSTSGSSNDGRETRSSTGTDRH
jgi:hypothetical protein